MRDVATGKNLRSAAELEAGWREAQSKLERAEARADEETEGARPRKPVWRNWISGSSHRGESGHEPRYGKHAVPPQCAIANSRVHREQAC